MSVVLGIDTSSSDCGIGIFRESVPVASYTRFVGNSHAEHITPVVRMVLESNGIAPDTVSRIAVAVGPGSFTGIRIGIAFVKGMAIGNEARILPVSSLAILAHAAVNVHGIIVSAIDARNNYLYTASFRCSSGAMIRETDDVCMEKEQFFSTLPNGATVVTDVTGYAKSTVFASFPSTVCHLPVERFPLQRGLFCAAIAAGKPDDDAAWLTSTDIHPNYLRQSTPELRRSLEVPV